MNLKPSMIKLVSRVLLCSFSVGILFETELLAAQVIMSSGPAIQASQSVSVAALQQRTNMLTNMQNILTPYLATYNTKTPMIGAGAGAWYLLQAAISTGNLLPGGQSLPSFKLADGSTVIPASNPADPTTLFGLLGNHLLAYSYAGLYNSIYSFPNNPSLNPPPRPLSQLDPNYQLLVGIMYFGDGSAVDVAAYGYPGNNDQIPPLTQTWSTNVTTAAAQQAMASFFQPGQPMSSTRYNFQPLTPAGTDPNFEQDLNGGLRSGILKKTGKFCAALDTAYGLPNTAITVSSGASQTQTTLGTYLNIATSKTPCAATDAACLATGTAWLGATCVTINDCCQNAYGQSKFYGAAGGAIPPAGETGYVDCINPVAQLPYGATGFPDPQDSSGKTMIKYGICDVIPAPAPQSNCGTQAGDKCGTIPTTGCCMPGSDLVPVLVGINPNQSCNCLIPVGSTTLSCQGNSALCAPSDTVGATVACVANVCTEAVPVQTCALFQGSCSPSTGAELSQTCCPGNNLICDSVSKTCLGDTGYVCNGNDSSCASGYSCDPKTKQCLPASCDLNKPAVAPSQTCMVNATAACCANTAASASGPASNFVCGLGATANTHICCSNDGKTYLTATDQAKCCADATLTQIAGTNDYVCAPGTPKPLPTPTPVGSPGSGSGHGISSTLEWGLIGGAAALVAMGIGAIAYARYNQHRYVIARSAADVYQVGIADFDQKNAYGNDARPQMADLRVAKARFGVTKAFRVAVCAKEVFSADLLSAPRSLSLGVGPACPDCYIKEEVPGDPDEPAPETVEPLDNPEDPDAVAIRAVLNTPPPAPGSGLINAADAGILNDLIAVIPGRVGGWTLSPTALGLGGPADILVADTEHVIARAYIIRRLMNPNEEPRESLSAILGGKINDVSKIILTSGAQDLIKAIVTSIVAKGFGIVENSGDSVNEDALKALIAADPGRASLLYAMTDEKEVTDANIGLFQDAWKALETNCKELVDFSGDPIFPNLDDESPELPDYWPMPTDLLFGAPE